MIFLMLCGKINLEIADLGINLTKLSDVSPANIKQ